MPSTHVSLNYHLIFSTKGRRLWIKESWKKRMYSYIGGIIRRLGGIALSIGGIADHVHIVASLNATCCLSDVMREIKSYSSGWIHSSIGNRMFGWQNGYGAFTVSGSDLEKIQKYVRGQKEHHRRKTFQEEYLDLLRQNRVEFDERYLW